MDEINVIVVDRGRKYLYLRYTDPVTGQKVEKSARTAKKREATKLAGEWEAELRNGKATRNAKLKWAVFRETYQEHVEAMLSKGTADKVFVMFNTVTDTMRPDSVQRISAPWVSRLQTELLKTREASTVESYCRHLKAALNWAKGQGLISTVPRFNPMKKARTAKLPSTVLVVAGLALLSPAFIFPLREHVWVSIFGVIPLYLGSGALLLAFLRIESSGIKLLNLGGALGAASYSIYLWHMPVAIWGWPMAQKLPGMGSYPSYFVFYMVGSLAFGWMMSKVVEWPVLRLRDRFFPSGARRAGCPEGKPAPERPDASLPAGPITAAR